METINLNPPFFFKNKNKILSLIACIFFLISLLFPYWLFIMRAPTYPERALVIAVYADRLAGDIEEWSIVSRLVGIKIPPPVPELDFKVIPILMVALASLALLSAFKGKKLSKIASIASWLSIIILMGWTQYKLYVIGHDLDETAPLRNYVKGGFTPPVIGSVNIGSITVYHWPYIGAILFLAATLLLTYVAFFSERKPVRG